MVKVLTTVFLFRRKVKVCFQFIAVRKLGDIITKAAQAAFLLIYRIQLLMSIT